MSAFKWVQAKPLKASRQTLLTATKSSLDERVWWDLMRLGLLNQSAPPFLPAKWNGSFCAIATDSGPSNFGHCGPRAASGVGPLRDRKPPSNRELATPFLGEVSPTDWVVTLRGLGRAPRGLALAVRADREPPSQRQARP